MVVLLSETGGSARADDALHRANDSEFGLVSYIWSNDLPSVMRARRELQAGTVWVNCYNVYDAAVPFGGYKMSGFGRESGPHHIEDYLETKAIWMKLD